MSALLVLLLLLATEDDATLLAWAAGAAAMTGRLVGMAADKDGYVDATPPLFPPPGE